MAKAKKSESVTSVLVNDVLKLINVLTDTKPISNDPFEIAAHTAAEIKRGNTPNAVVKRELVQSTAAKLFERYDKQTNSVEEQTNSVGKK